jgi:phospholipase/lecithinase/hemolysin
MRLALWTVALGCLVVSLAAHAVPFTSLFVFGDSNSDNGRRLALQGTKPKSPPYHEGRHTNGPVAVEYLASSLGLGPGEFVDYAVGGALSGRVNVDLDPVLSLTGLLDQFDTFKLAHPTADPDALYFVYGGDNDLNECRGTSGNGCSPAQIDAAVDNLETLVNGLAALGAEHFLVIGSYGGGGSKDQFRALLKQRTRLIDSALPDADIGYLDLRPQLLQMIAPANPYGFTHRSSAAPCYTGNLLGTTGSVCPDPQTYVFWDPNGHLTAPAQRIMGDLMIAAIPAPGSLGLLGLALGLLVGRPRMRANQRSIPVAPAGTS